ncbi:MULTISPECIES: dTDP-glucose 4,6-dehydratase [Clostridium]|uniref:dTDP-glucose 4,6-dehydratase n=1 Tax=Clostridium TaxID=1485 RepID=UPI000825BA52|nr:MULTISPECIES: GDP-mannose 4,6-dehydratase [Clostridium]PJI09843.1 NAD-dependent dehydratase [Clostridium sp. CT7]
MKVLVTGGAGFIGRWVVKRLLKDNNEVTAIDNLSNGNLSNISEFKSLKNFSFYKGDIKDNDFLDTIFKNEFDIIFHLAASINVQDSIDDPKTTFFNDAVGTFNILQKAKQQMFGKDSRMQGDEWNINVEKIHSCKVVFMSTCMVYDKCDESGINEKHPTKPVSPYGGSKIAAENMVLSYYHAYGLPAVVIRPFNTYGPFQKSGGEGGVVSIFIKSSLEGKPIKIYGSGDQTRDLLFVKDCAEFIVQCGYNDNVNGEIVNAGTGEDIKINELAELISNNRVKVIHVKHIHPQSEIMKLKCDYSKAQKILAWKPKYNIKDGIMETEKWIYNNKL